MIPARLLPVALLLAAMLPGAAAAQDGEDPPRIFLEKKVYSDTAGGKQSFFETYTVEKGDTLWKILERKETLTPDRYAERLKEFLRANPKVADPSRIAPGQKLLVPSGGRPEAKDDGRTVGYTVKRGDSLSKILFSLDVPRREWKKYFDAIREINTLVTDVNRIVAGKTLRLPTEGYFTQALPPAEPEKAMAVAEPVKAAIAPEPSGPAAPALTRDIAAGPGTDVLAAGKPAAELLVPKPVPRQRRSWRRGRRSPRGRSSPPRRGLRTGGSCRTSFWRSEKSGVDRGTMYLPLPSGEDVVLQLSDFPVVRFSGGAEALIDFRGGIPPRVVDAISSQWKSLRVVSLADAGGVGDRIDRILRVSGYHSVKEGISRPVVMGETVSVALPARWIIQRTEDSLLSGDLILLKEVPEKPGPELLAVLRYARRIGLRVLPYADDPNAMEGFLLGIQEERRTEGSRWPSRFRRRAGSRRSTSGSPSSGSPPGPASVCTWVGREAPSGSWFRPSASSRPAGRSTSSIRGGCPPRSNRSSGNRDTPSSWRERTFPAGRFSGG